MLFLFVFYHAHAMEIIKKKPSIPCGDVCYLNLMPREILNYIASFLMESEEEFITRTLAEKKKKDGMYKNFRCYAVSLPNQHLRSRGNNKVIVLSGDGSRLALCDGLEDVRRGMYCTELEKSTYDCCALSPNGTMIAIFHRQFLPGEEYRTAILELLKVRTEDVPGQKNGNLIIEERREIFRINEVCFRSLSFNQQGWQLIGWYLASYDTINERNYRIFPLPTSCSSINRLQEYLRDAFVCKTYIEGTK